MGIGIGLIIATIFMFGYKVSDKYSEDKIEQKAREMNMHYQEECKVTFSE